MQRQSTGKGPTIVRCPPESCSKFCCQLGFATAASLMLLNWIFISSCALVLPSAWWAAAASPGG